MSENYSITFEVDGYAVDTSFSYGQARLRLWLDFTGALRDRKLSRYTPTTSCCGSLLKQQHCVTCGSVNFYPRTIQGEPLPDFVGVGESKNAEQDSMEFFLEKLNFGALEAAVYASLWHGAVENFLSHERFQTLAERSAETAEEELQFFKDFKVFCQDYNAEIA